MIQIFNQNLEETANCGMNGCFHKGINICTGKLVAIQKIQLDSVFENSIPSVLTRDVALLNLIRHPNIVSLEHVIINNGHFYMIFEFVNMNLATYISKLPNDKWMDRTEQKSYLYQILQAINFCHQQNILHLDLRPANLLINQTGCIKLAKFRFDEVYNVAAFCSKKDHLHFYKAPELLFGCTHYTSAVDIWSIGCIAAEMALKKPLFSLEDSNTDQIFRIFCVLSIPSEETLRGFTNTPGCSKTFPKWKKNHLNEILDGLMDANGITIVQKMLTYEPEERITAEELLENSYFDDIDQTMLSTYEQQ